MSIVVFVGFPATKFPCQIICESCRVSALSPLSSLNLESSIIRSAGTQSKAQFSQIKVVDVLWRIDVYHSQIGEIISFLYTYHT
jgi:hypothetical protein